MYIHIASHAYTYMEHIKHIYTEEADLNRNRNSKQEIGNSDVRLDFFLN